MSKYQQHQNQLNKTTLYLQKKFPDARFFTQHVGKFYSQRIFKGMPQLRSLEDLKQWLFAVSKKYLITINSPGMPDQYMILPVIINGKKIPLHVAIETKTGSGRLTPDQNKWRKIYEKLGVKFITSRDEIEVEKQLNEYVEYINNKD